MRGLANAGAVLREKRNLIITCNIGTKCASVSDQLSDRGQGGDVVDSSRRNEVSPMRPNS